MLFSFIEVYMRLPWLYQDLIKSQALKTHDKLPPVMPIVLHRGQQASGYELESWGRGDIRCKNLGGGVFAQIKFFGT